MWMFLLSEARVELRLDWFHFGAPAPALDGRSICVSAVNTSEDNKENGDGK